MSEARWIVFAGLPGTGKTTLSSALATERGTPRFDKDRIREAVFGPGHVAYDGEQDDHCMELAYASARFLLDRGAASEVLIDGRTFLKHGALAQLLAAVGRDELIVVEFRCSTASAHARILGANHPALNRTIDLHDELSSAGIDLTATLAGLGGPRPRILDTDRGLEPCLDELRAWLDS